MTSLSNWTQQNIVPANSGGNWWKNLENCPDLLVQWGSVRWGSGDWASLALGKHRKYLAKTAARLDPGLTLQGKLFLSVRSQAGAIIRRMEWSVVADLVAEMLKSSKSSGCRQNKEPAGRDHRRPSLARVRPPAMLAETEECSGVIPPSRPALLSLSQGRNQ